MSFTYLAFLFGFFPIAWLLGMLIPGKFKNIYLLIISLFFYAWGSLKSLVILGFILLWNYFGAAEIEQEKSPSARKRILWITVGVDLAVLALYKYLFIWLESLGGIFGISFGFPLLAAPIGLSFYLFSSLSCLFDVYRGKEKLCSLVDFGIFAAFFAWVNMGPVAHYTTLKKQLDHHPVTVAKLQNGAALFIQGFVFKVFFADQLAVIFESLLSNTTLLGSWLCIGTYTLELYFDFCGYSRMARGMASLFGFEIPKNFDHPLRAKSIQQFWRRWHISLTLWFREYVYIPLGGNRVSQNRWVINILIVWMLTGIWHGATLSYILWGVVEAAYLISEKLWTGKVIEKAPGALRHLYVILSQVIAFTFFLSASALSAFGMLGRYVGIGVTGLADAQSLYFLIQYWLLITLAVLVCTGFFEKGKRWITGLIKGKWVFWTTVGYAGMFLISLSLLVSQSAQAFLYAAF